MSNNKDHLVGQLTKTNKTSQMENFSLKKENGQELLQPASKANFENAPSKGHFNTTVALTNNKINVELQDLDEQIKSMITKSDVSYRNGAGKMSSCNICGKEGPLKDMSTQTCRLRHCRGMLKQTISPESRTPVTCVEKFSGQEIR